MAAPTVAQRKKKLLKSLPIDGTFVSNSALMDSLKWGNKTYWSTRNELLEEQKIKIGRGYGGSVALVVQRKEKKKAEADHYRHIEAFVKTWYENEVSPGNDRFFVEIIAHQGAKSTGGQWTRPDIVLVSIESFKYIAGSHTEILTFEVKTDLKYDVYAVYEALAHAKSATMSYVVLKHQRELDQSAKFKRIRSECERHGIGLIIFERETDIDTYVLIVDAVRRPTDFEELNDFVEAQISGENKGRLLRWLKP